MTDSEREEFIFDLANHELKGKPQSFIHALAIDRMCDLLSGNSDEQLVNMAPSNLIVDKKKRSKHKKAKGF